MKMFQINEQDLARLEAAIPRIMDLAGEALNDPAAQVMFEEVKEVLGNVRWNYGPYTEVRRAPPSEQQKGAGE